MITEFKGHNYICTNPKGHQWILVLDGEGYFHHKHCPDCGRNERLTSEELNGYIT